MNLSGALVPSLVVVLIMSSSTPLFAADPIESHPLAGALKRAFAEPGKDAKPSNVTRADYLKLIAGNVDFFKTCQNEAGAIIDPVSKGERQYSTPAFALAAGLLVKEADRKDLLEPASKAMTRALTALVDNQAADKHADFYIPMLVHAHRVLKDVVAPEQEKAWRELFARINPETMYRADLRHMNWNLVSSSGELLRRHDKLVDPKMADAQWKYLEKCLGGHLESFKPMGFCEDPGAPWAYDAFSRLWLEDVLADNAYAGVHAKKIEAFLRTGGLSTLLVLSPTGEWMPGGRSGLHNWTDAQVVAICEINANYWKKQKRDDVAGAFKRAARLAFASMARWQRPSGELWIIKNRAEPSERLAYEGYSNHSQYNLLPMAMLAIAYERSDDSINEHVTPSEVGGYVFDLREPFHKIVAAAGGYFAVIDTGADPHYEATGLQRVHRTGVAFPALSDSAPGDRAFGPKEAPKVAMSLGVAWKSGEDWVRLADFNHEKNSPRRVKSAELKVEKALPGEVAFDIGYVLSEKDKEWNLKERYAISASGVEQQSAVSGASGSTWVEVPVLVSDGAADTDIKLNLNTVTISNHGSSTSIAVLDKASPLKLKGPRLPHHNGYVQKATSEVAGVGIVKITLSASAQ